MKDKWIKISDRLPEDEEYVLVLFKDYDNLSPQVCRWIIDIRGEGIWVDRHYCRYDVCWSTHWMPIGLPEEDVEAK